MISINPQPELSLPIVKPREDETLQAWLARKIHTRTFYSWYPYLQFNDRDFGVVFGRSREESNLILV